MNVAMGFGSTWGNFEEAVKQNKALTYWWTPDVTFLHMRMKGITFPPHNPTESAAGFRVSAQSSHILDKWSDVAIKSASPRATNIVDKFSLAFQTVEDLLYKQ